MPAFPEWDDTSNLHRDGLDHLVDLPCHRIEVFDNKSNIAHLNYLRGCDVQRYKNEVMVSIIVSGSPAPVLGASLAICGVAIGFIASRTDERQTRVIAAC